jgi:hypothetical protein
MNKITIFAPAVLMFLASCFGSKYKQNVIIEDVTKPLNQVIQVQIEPDEYVDKLTIRISGNVNDTIIINRFIIPPGEIDFSNKGDYYYHEIHLKYNPMKTTEGHIEVEFIFLAY